MNITINNANLQYQNQQTPTIKNYITTTENDQGIDISSLIGSYKYNKVKIEASFIALPVSGTSNCRVFFTNNSYVNINAKGTTLTCKLTEDVTATIVSGETNSVTIDPSVPSVTINSDTTSVSGTVSGTSITSAFLLCTPSGSSTAGMVKLNSIKFTDIDNSTVIADLKPALDLNNTPCLYDTENGVCYYEKDSGTLAVG